MGSTHPRRAQIAFAAVRARARGPKVMSPSDRASQTARRKAIYEKLNGPAKANGARAANAAMGRGDANENFAFASETAKTTGQSERVVQLHAERGEKVADERRANHPCKPLT